MIIYRTVNLINGKIYIGKDSKNNPNYYGSGKLINVAIHKYGIGNFIKEILEDNISSIEKLNEREKFWIKKTDAQNPTIGYNLTEGGDGWSSEFLRGKPKSLEHRKSLSKFHHDVSGEKNPMFGKHHSEEAVKRIKEKIKKWNENIGYSEEQINKMKKHSSGRSNPNYNSTPILEFSIDGILIKEWQDLLSLKEAGYNSKLISAVCRQCPGRKTAFNKIWKFKI